MSKMAHLLHSNHFGHLVEMTRTGSRIVDTSVLLSVVDKGMIETCIWTQAALRRFLTPCEVTGRDIADVVP